MFHGVAQMEATMDFELTNYNFYSSRLDMELISNIVDTLKSILEEDKKEEQPLFLRVADDFIMNIARKVVQEKKKTFLKTIDKLFKIASVRKTTCETVTIKARSSS